MSASKVFLVTGASKGLGAAIVDYLLGQSHKVVITARSSDALEARKAAHPGEVEAVAGDMTRSGIAEELISAAVRSFGKLDGMVLCHGVLTADKVKDTSPETYKHVYDVNLFSCISMAQAGLQELRKAKGCVVWISSGAATKAYTAWSAYGSSKAALNSVAAHLAVEEPDITSIAIGPGRVDTGMQGLLRDIGKDVMDKAQYQSFVDAHNQGELLKPSQPGSVIARFVASPDKALSGKYLSWTSPEMAAFQES